MVLFKATHTKWMGAFLFQDKKGQMTVAEARSFFEIFLDQSKDFHF
jgi:hypothetical protein